VNISHSLCSACFNLTELTVPATDFHEQTSQPLHSQASFNLLVVASVKVSEGHNTTIKSLKLTIFFGNLTIPCSNVDAERGLFICWKIHI